MWPATAWYLHTHVNKLMHVFEHILVYTFLFECAYQFIRQASTDRAKVRECVYLISVSKSVQMCVPYQRFQSVWMCVPYQCLTRTGECGLSVRVEKGMKIVFTSWCQLRVHVWNQFNACNKCLKSKLRRSCNSMFTTPHCTFTYSWVVTYCTIYSVTNKSCEMFAASPLNWISYLFFWSH